MDHMDMSTPSDERPPAAPWVRVVLVEHRHLDALVRSGGTAPPRSYRARCRLTRRELLGDREISR